VIRLLRQRRADRRIGAVDGGAGYVVGRVQIVLVCTAADLIELDPVTAA
jgi:hypothetical protein